MSEAVASKKKVALLGMPSYGELSAGAARAFFRASLNPDLALTLHQQEGSLLAQNMNILWTLALNAAASGNGCDYFAMLHADCEPQDGWLDTLIAEMESKGLDVLGVAVPIKDQRGLTSLAMAHESGDTWRIHGRLTMTEVYRLPETFTSDDVGHPLLLNTGCWVCRFDLEWAKKVHFTINDRIVYNTKTKVYQPQVEPEDWFVSRLFHELGLRIGATRKVELGHRGPTIYGNHKAWGTDHHDTHSLTASVLDHDTANKDWFPSDVAGWLTEREGRELARLANGKTVLEIGAYCGRSTICLAKSAKNVHAIDTFEGTGTPLEGDTLPTFKANIERYKVNDKVAFMQGNSHEIVPHLPPVFDLVFIDGSHDESSVAADAIVSASVLKPGGVLVFHDYDRGSDPGVTAAVNGLIAAGGVMVSRCESLAVVRPPVKSLELAGV